MTPAAIALVRLKVNSADCSFTGTRKDAYAEKRRIKVEEEKGSRDGLVKKGEYIAKECFGEKE